MSKLCDEDLNHILNIMHMMKVKIAEDNWDELNNLDAERRQVILEASSGLKECEKHKQSHGGFLRSNNEEETPYNLNPPIEQQSSGRNQLIEQIKLLDKEIIEACYNARANLLEATRQLSTQAKVKDVYAKASTLSR